MWHEYCEYKIFSSEETKELFKQMKEGNPFAREDLINKSINLVLST